jgi:hypothetical protein
MFTGKRVLAALGAALVAGALAAVALAFGEDLAPISMAPAGGSVACR